LGKEKWFRGSGYNKTTMPHLIVTGDTTHTVASYVNLTAPLKDTATITVSSINSFYFFIIITMIIFFSFPFFLLPVSDFHLYSGGLSPLNPHFL
jgi:hypothetical protein